MKTFSYSNAKHTPRVTLILLTVDKIEGEIFDFVLSVFVFFPSYIAEKLYGVYKQSPHQMAHLLSEIFLFLVIAACMLRLVSCHSKHMLQSLSYTPFGGYLHVQLEN